METGLDRAKRYLYNLITNFRRVAVAPVLFPFTGLHLLEFKGARLGGALLDFLDRSFEISAPSRVAIVASRLF